MKLSTRARYALRMMVAIARTTENGQAAVSLTDVSKKTRISRRYLEQLAIALKNASLIRGKTGKGGGYHLSKSAANIELSQIVEAAIGPINIVDCVLEPESCFLADDCECREVYCKINTGIQDILSDITLDSLAAKNIKKKALKTVSRHSSDEPSSKTA
ncbi:MAG: Rrf2 family transcriptional regulator [Proteobacteria bacterium]|nr:Rrf2 family transcriptional regulator [Pseudomonadota bacterium]